MTCFVRVCVAWKMLVVVSRRGKLASGTDVWRHSRDQHGGSDAERWTEAAEVQATARGTSQDRGRTSKEHLESVDTKAISRNYAEHYTNMFPKTAPLIMPTIVPKLVSKAAIA